METINNPIDTTGGGFGQSDGQNTNMTRSRPNFNPGMFDDDRRDISQAPILVGVGGALVFFSLCLLAARFWSRMKPTWKLRLDDWAILSGVILAVAQYIIIVISVLHGLGRRSFYVASAKRRTSLRLLFISQLFWYWSLTLIKLSVALLLLRLKYTKRWRIFLYSTMFLTVAAAVVQTAFQFLQCRPFSVYWDPRVFRTEEVTCFRRSIINVNIVSFSSIQIGLDLVFTFVPIIFIGKLNRPRREKVLMCVLMGLGLFASCAAVIRTLTVQGVRNQGDDSFQVNVSIALWAVVEQHFAIAAATIPTLKSFMENTLMRFGVIFYEEKSEEKVRMKLVGFGLLDESDLFDEDEAMRLERRASAASTIVEGESQSQFDVGKKAEDTDFDFEMHKDDQLTFEEMLRRDEDIKARSFV